ncbi:MAG: hypothetical protein AYK18_07980 [Theionarchaea archaeon DG-70]|nr:MAG: hypothetical protein AYK18_07980 [Theionarchaea archaeon DG-70]
MTSDSFVTPNDFEDHQKKKMIGPNGWLLFVACNSGIDLAQSVLKEYNKFLVQRGCVQDIPILGTKENPITQIFPDTETCPRLNMPVAGSDAYVFQNVHENISGNTVNENIQQLLQVLRTLKSHRVKNMTVVVPYCPYARQDKPTFLKRESSHAKFFADQIRISGANIILTYHPHTYALHGFYEPGINLIALSGLDLFIEISKNKEIDKNNVVAVSTDVGGGQYVVNFAKAIGISYAIANKYRTHKGVGHTGIIGALRKKTTAIIIDDETVTGSSVMSTIDLLNKKYSIKYIYVLISHMKLRSEFMDLFINAHKEYGLKELHTTDSVPQNPSILKHDFVIVHSLATKFARTINRLHYNQSVSELFYSPA